MVFFNFKKNRKRVRVVLMFEFSFTYQHNSRFLNSYSYLILIIKMIWERELWNMLLVREECFINVFNITSNKMYKSEKYEIKNS